MIDRARHVLRLYLAGLMFLGLLLVMPVVGPAFEAQFVPIIESPVLLSQDRVDDRAVFRIYANRNRAECQYESIVALRHRNDNLRDAVTVETPFASRGAGISRPIGPQSLGFWWVDAQPGDTVTFVVRYSCHFMWDTMAQLGPWKVER